MKYLARYFWLVFLLGYPITSKACEPGFLKIKFNETQSQIKVEVADTFENRKKGLMFRKSLDDGSGMLFVYESPRVVNFWMKNTQLSLDIAFVDTSGIVKRVVQNTVPFSLDLIPGGKNIQYVIEVNAGSSKEINLLEGSQIQHQKLGEAAIWQC